MPEDTPPDEDQGSPVQSGMSSETPKSKTGIHLPDKIEIPTLTGRIVAVSAEVDRNADYPIKKYDRVLFNPKHGIPVDFEGDNRLYVIPVEDVVAIFRRGDD
jgi:chaperonin GroES